MSENEPSQASNLQALPIGRVASHGKKTIGLIAICISSIRDCFLYATKIYNDF